MPNVLIVDDENFVVKSLVSSINWDSLKLHVSTTCTNGVDALDYIEHHPIDIVITDIRMPGFTGLDLCSSLHTKYPHIKIILISGYADFAYAQKAIKYNVIGYCVKPLDYDELTLILSKAVASQKAINPPTLDIIDCISNEDYKSISTFLLDHAIDPHQFYMMITMGADALNINITCPKIILKFGPLKYLYILARPLYPYDLPTGLLATLQIKGVGIYPHPLTLKQLKQAIDDTIIMAYQFFFLGVPCLCTTLTACNHSSILSKLQNGLSTNNLGAIRSTLSELITSEQLKKYDISFAMKLYNLLITHYIVQHQFETEDLYGYNFDELINKFESFSSMLTYLDDVFCEQLPIEDLSHSYNNNFIHILKYVNHYYMHDISIRDVAAELGLNANYISQLFKKETGYTYTKYLTRLRMEKAKQLLLETSLSISDICEQVGYNDYFYFLKTFKKYTGLSPSNYKVQLISSNQKCLSSMSL